LPNISRHDLQNEAKVRSLGAIELFHLCAGDPGYSEAWAEFLRRYSVKLKYFISGTLRQLDRSSSGGASVFSGGIQLTDLFQNAVLRLVENDCAAMKRFSGKDESELLAYLAVICRSSVLDTLRRNSAAKRGFNQETREDVGSMGSFHFGRWNNSEFERRILVGELVALTQNTIESHSYQLSERDQLVFNLHFFHGLSFSQISQCRGINLSKSGVEKLLKRLIGRVQVLASAGKSGESL
jgi:RNA polymerase sigma factor (sigma-70 family)